MEIANLVFFGFPFAWNIFFHPLTFSLYECLRLKWASCRQHIYGSCFCIHSASLCLLERMGEANKITDKELLSGIQVAQTSQSSKAKARAEKIS